VVHDDAVVPEPEQAKALSFGGPTATELARDQVRTAIIRGDLIPGQAIRLRELAEAHEVRIEALTAALAGLDREHLLTVRGDMAFVAPLNSANLIASQRFGRLISQSLIPCAFQLMTPAHLERAEQLLLERSTHLVDYAEDVVRKGAMTIATMFDTACGPVDRRELQGLLDHNSRYSFFSGQVLDSERVRSALDYAASQREILELVRVGRAELAAKGQLELFQRLHVFERLSLEYPYRTDDDSPLADVIPLRRIS
jgi:DNA-binding GntR family transcriptional regulator